LVPNCASWAKACPIILPDVSEAHPSVGVRSHQNQLVRLTSAAEARCSLAQASYATLAPMGRLKRSR